MPAPFTTHSGIAAPMAVDNVDTDQIIPSREMKTVGRSGLGEGLFAGWRYSGPDTRALNMDFVLNQPRYDGASILVSGSNFGCGSSREHAVWALAEFGIRAVIAKSFGDIFYNNCTRNGILPIRLPVDVVDETLRFTADARKPVISIDLDAQTLVIDGVSHSFDLEPYAKRLLLEGLDPIGLTLMQKDRIAAFHQGDAVQRPWVYS